MQTRKGFTLIELLLVVSIVGIMVAIAIPSLLRARQTVDRRTLLFGVTFENLPAELTPEHRRVLRPWVTERIGKICGPTTKKPAPTEASPAKAQPAADSEAIQRELNRLAGLPGNPPSEYCKAILAAAQREGFLPLAPIDP
ncbi:MAG TPA: type II secretion system protein [Candidatus Paceibacterota bacterium]|nr:type II secretion system protein [Candidatus Paceibacterota bacterium]